MVNKVLRSAEKFSEPLPLSPLLYPSANPGAFPNAGPVFWSHVERKQKGDFEKGGFWRMCPRSGFWYLGTSDCTLVPVFGAGGTSECILVPVFTQQ